MTFYPPNRRPVTGTEQLGEHYELLTTREYAAKHSYTRDAVVKQCRCKKLTAYKSGGQWYIVVPKA